MKKKIKIEWIKSAIGKNKSHKNTIRSLGLKKLHNIKIIEDNPAMRGMILKVIHLLKVEPFLG